MNFSIEKIHIPAVSHKLSAKWVNVTNPCSEISLGESSVFCILGLDTYAVYDVVINEAGLKIYHVGVGDQVVDWLCETFTEGIDYKWNRSLKGVWVEISEELFILLKLKWI